MTSTSSTDRFAALGHPLRARILAALRAGPGSGSELARSLGRPKSTVAYHLGRLERAGLIRVVASRRARAMTEHLYGLTAAPEVAVSQQAALVVPSGASDPFDVARIRRPLAELSPSSQAGVLRFIHYAFMPNRLGYCGPNDNRRLFDHGVEGEATASLVPTLARFLGPLPYLRAIAAGSGLRDLYDDRVVEAYWIGNDLLDTYAAGELYEALNERFRRELPPRIMELVAAKIPAGAVPHHSFHVLDVWRRVGRLDGDVLATLDHCRISWGRVTSVDGATVGVTRAALVLRDGGLALGTPAPVHVTRLVDGRGFVTELAPGDLVSLHWGWVCERLSERQVRDLRRYTLHNVRIANDTI